MALNEKVWGLKSIQADDVIEACMLKVMAFTLSAAETMGTEVVDISAFTE